METEEGKEIRRARFLLRDFMRLMNPRPIGNEAYVPTEVEHLANVATHALSILPSLFAFKLLVQKAHTPAHYAAAMVYGAALIMLFVVSSLFHSVHFIGKLRLLKEIMHRCDRAAIYIFIASAYTPWWVKRTFTSSAMLLRRRLLSWVLSPKEAIDVLVERVVRLSFAT
ncbi:unnamed protein product [Ixodes persulcatus]